MKEMTLKEVQQVSLDILQEFHDFCTRNDIKYSLSGGTLLGAIRHNGFIPWDDDIDVQMPRPDYDKFIHTYVSGDKYKLYCRELLEFDNQTMGFPYARLCDMQRTFVDQGLKPLFSEEIGLGIDILPCDGMPSDEREARIHLRNNFIMQERAYWSCLKYLPWASVFRAKGIKEKLKFVVKKLFSSIYGLQSFEKVYKIKKKYDYETSDYFFAIPHYGMREWQPKKNMESFILHQFENRQFYIMSGYEANLKRLFGNYMELPPESKRITHNFNRYYWRKD